MTIRKKISGILGLHIEDWDDTWRAAEVQGKLTGSKTNLIIKELCKRVEVIDEILSSKSTD